MPSQYRAIWTVPGGGTGYSVFNFQNAGDSTEAQAIADDVHDFFDAFEGNVPNDVQFSFDSEVTVHDLDGTLTSVFAVTPGAPITGAWTGGFARAQGLRIDWQTGHIVEGRRLTGRTYIVPVANTMFDDNGALTPAAVTAWTGYGQDFIDATGANSPLVVWSRTHNIAWAADTASVPANGAILRSRRD